MSVYSSFRNFRVQKFDRDGQYLLTAGRKGQGPGEFEGPSRLSVERDSEEIYVKDRSRVEIFDREGNYSRDILVKGTLYDFVLDGNGNLWGMLSILTDTYPLHAFAKLNGQGTVEKEIAKFPFEWTQSQMGENVMIVTTGEEHDISFARRDGDSLIYGFSKEYGLTVTDKEGNVLFIIRKDEPPRSFSSEELKKYDKGRIKINLPSHKRYFYNVYTDNEGRIYVQRDAGERYESGKREYDIFSRDGYYLYKTTLSHPPLFIDNGDFHTRTENEESGEELVKRFRIINWDKLKKGAE